MTFTMNVTLILALLSLVLWIVLGFVIALPSGAVHVLYAVGMMLLARRVLVGAPRFIS
jgi:hypothetical protein